VDEETQKVQEVKILRRNGGDKKAEAGPGERSKEFDQKIKKSQVKLMEAKPIKNIGPC
jgi:hypothetical protein